jgi:hypothetical protein
MSALSITPDQLASAGGYIAREYGECGYRIVEVGSPTRAVSTFCVVAADGSRFVVAVDRWSNCRTLPDDMAARIDAVREMHVKAVSS